MFECRQSLPASQILLEQCEGGSFNDHILAIDKYNKSVHWYSAGGVRLIRQFQFDSIPVDAKFCCFETIQSEKEGEGNTSILRNALAVILSNDDVHISFISGESYDIHLPYPVKKMLAPKQGLIFQREVIVPSSGFQLFWMSHPLAPCSYVDFHPSVLDILEVSDSTIMSIDQNTLCSMSADGTTLNLLLINRMSKESTAQPYLLSSRLDPSKLQQGMNVPVSEDSGIMDPMVSPDMIGAGTAHFEDQSHIGYKSPMQLSRENSPIAWQSGNTIQYSVRRSDNAALQSLLASSPDPATATVLERSTSDVLPHTLRSQPIIYSRGHSAGSSNSNSAYHIRKKRATSGGSPVPSPSPSPSGFMFESSIHHSGGLSSNYSVDITSTGIPGRAAYRSESPRHSAGSNSSFMDTRSGPGATGWNDRARQSLSTAGPETDPALPSMGSAEVFISHVGELKLPSGAPPLHATQMTVHFTGALDGLTGWMLHVYDCTAGLYYTYTIKPAVSAGHSSLGVNGCENFHINTPLVEAIQYSLSLSYTNFQPKDLSAEIDSYRGIAHVRVPLVSAGAEIYTQHFENRILPMKLRYSLTVPVTVILTSRRSILLLVGSQIVREAPLHWQDDLAELKLEESLFSSTEEEWTLCTPYSRGACFAVVSQAGTRILSLSSLIPSTDPAATSVLTAPSASLFSDCISAVVYSLLGLQIDGLVESTVGFIAKLHAQVSMRSLGWLAAAACGIDFETFSTRWCEGPTSEVLALHRTACSSGQLAELYQQFAADAVELYEQSQHSICLGVEIMHTLHAVSQEYALRYGEEVSVTSPLCSVLHDVLLLLKHCIDSSEYISMSEGLHLLRDDYLSYYLDRTAATSEVDANVWCAGAIEELSRSASYREENIALPAYPLPFPVAPSRLCAFPTIALTARLLEFLAGRNPDASPSPAKNLLDGFVFSVHGPDTLAEWSASWECSASDHACNWASLLDFFPPALRTVLTVAVEQCRVDPRSSWPAYLLRLVQRQDLGGYAMNRDTLLALKTFSAGIDSADMGSSTTAPAKAQTSDSATSSSSDGLLEVEKASLYRFTEDDRVHEVCRMLRSSQPFYLKYEKAPEVSELDHRHKLQLKLLNLVKRSLATPVGRGMLTMCSLEPFMAEALPIPQLSLSGRVPPSNSIIVLNTTNAHADLTLWPDFHNGVAAALRVGTTETDGGSGMQGRKTSTGVKVTRNWIMYNRTASQVKPNGDDTHAGFLLGLGLLGHLTVLTTSDSYEYLKQAHEPTTIAVLIGSAASRVGSADPRVFKTISLFMPALLPAPHGDIEIAPAIQAAGLAGLGLLYCGSGHRMMSEFLLNEMSRSPSSDRCDNREAMVTAAAWALGMVLLGKGSNESLNDNDKLSSKKPPLTPAHGRGGGVHAHTAAQREMKDALRGLQDLRVEARLMRFIDGGKRPGESSLFPSHPVSDVSSRSSRMLQGDDINVNITAPGALIALGLIFIRSNNADILLRLAIPSTAVALDSVWSDILLYRALASCLVKWDSLEPSLDWMRSQIPDVILRPVFPSTSTGTGMPPASSKDPKLLYQSGRQLSPRVALSHYLCAMTGYCFGTGLVFAGTSDIKAKTVILSHLKVLQSFREGKPSIKFSFPVDKVLRSTIEMCVCSTALALSIVMAGSGDLDSLRILRELRWKVEEVMYGTHMALSMGIGMLFLGGGNFSLRRDPLSTACLLMSLLPKYPMRTVEQQYHLQATRHLYVLAVEPRALHTIDVDSGLTVPVDVEVELVSGEVVRLAAPGLLPELSTVRKISTVTESNQAEGNTATASAEGGPPKPQYYPASITLIEEDNSPSRDNSPGHCGLERSAKFRHLRGSHRQLAVPPLFVKPIYPPSYLSPHAASKRHLNTTATLKVAAAEHSSSPLLEELRATVAAVPFPLYHPTAINTSATTVSTNVFRTEHTESDTKPTLLLQAIERCSLFIPILLGSKPYCR